jgi:RNA polymerase sigma-70 factor (ECF subfamily)
VERDVDNVTDAVLAGEDRRRVAACLEGLTDIQRECIELAYYQGMTYVQVSEKLSANLATVKSRMRDGLRGLRNCLGVR